MNIGVLYRISFCQFKFFRPGSNPLWKRGDLEAWYSPVQQCREREGENKSKLSAAFVLPMRAHTIRYFTLERNRYFPKINLSSSLEHLLKFFKVNSAKNKNCASHQSTYTERFDLLFEPFFVKEIRRVIDWLREIKTADQHCYKFLLLQQNNFFLLNVL